MNIISNGAESCLVDKKPRLIFLYFGILITTSIGQELPLIFDESFENPNALEAWFPTQPDRWKQTDGTLHLLVYAAHFVGAWGHSPTIEGVTTKSDVDFGSNRIVNRQLVPSSQPGFGLHLPN